jgi:hypothetical protein
MRCSKGGCAPVWCEAPHERARPPRSAKPLARFGCQGSPLSSPALEAFLARLYSDEQLLERFLADPRGTAQSAQLSVSETAALTAIDRDGLRLAANSYARKRAMRSAAGTRFKRWMTWVMRVRE